jgi:hypothetical protein
MPNVREAMPHHVHSGVREFERDITYQGLVFAIGWLHIPE